MRPRSVPKQGEPSSSSETPSAGELTVFSRQASTTLNSVLVRTPPGGRSWVSGSQHVALVVSGSSQTKSQLSSRSEFPAWRSGTALGRSRHTKGKCTRTRGTSSNDAVSSPTLVTHCLANADVTGVPRLAVISLLRQPGGWSRLSIVVACALVCVKPPYTLGGQCVVADAATFSSTRRDQAQDTTHTRTEMKVPLEREPFQPVALTENQEDQLKWLSEAILDDTYSEYEDFVTSNNRVLDKNKWKHVMARENVAIYKRVGKGDLGGVTPDVSLDRRQLENRTITWKMPGVVGVGSLTGSLDDLLYGIVATTKIETDIRTTYIKDQAGDSRVLANVVHPTEEDPLSALLVRWSLVHQLVHKLGATPRDVVNMESVGSRILPSGERMGYVVIQSVDIPECGELRDLGIIRMKFSTCYILRDVGNNTVELYMRAFLNPGGRLTEGVAVFSACSSLVAVWRVLLSGQNKKLAWMMRRAVANRSNQSSKATDLFAQAREDSAKKSCPICDKSTSGLRFSVKCDLCLTKVCSRCIDKRKLTHVTHNGKLIRVPTRFCKSCVMRAAQISSREVAVTEHVPWWGRQDSGNTGFSTSPHSVVYSDLSFVSSRPSRAHTITDTNRSATSLASTESEDHTVDYDSDASLASFDEGYTPRYRRSSVRSVPVVSEEDEAFAGVDPQQLDMWIRINQLRVAAEETFVMTKRNTGAMLEAQDTRAYKVL